MLPSSQSGNANASSAAEPPDAVLPDPAEFVPGADPLLVPYVVILQQIPEACRGKLAPAGVAGCNFEIAKARVLEQLPRGAVKVTLADLKRAAPRGVFAEDSGHDGEEVDLPLRYLLRQLLPEDYMGSVPRQRVEVPKDIADVFNASGESAAQVRIVPNSPPFPSVVPPRPPPTRTHAPRASGPAPASAPIPKPIPKPIPGPIPGPIPAPSRAPSPAPVPPPAAAPPMEAPAFNSAPLIPIHEGPGPGVRLRVSDAGSKPAPPPVPGQSPIAMQMFQVALEEVAVAWPEAIRTEIAQLKVPFAKCALPATEVCDGLKRGKLQYTWGDLRSRISPHPPQAPSPLAETRLDLPLNIVAPLFLEFIRSGASRPKAVEPERVTEFFRKAERETSAAAFMHGHDRPAARETPPAPTLRPATRPAAAPALESEPASEAAAAGAGGIGERMTAAPVRGAGQGSDQGSDGQVVGAKGGCVGVPLNLVSGAWPEPVRQEIAQAGFSQARIEIPFVAIEPGLRQGKIEFHWLQVCSWLTPPVPLDYESPHSEARLTFPLSVVAPIFLQQKLKKLRSRRQAAPANIPDLFTPEGKLVAPVAPTPTQPASPAPAPGPDEGRMAGAVKGGRGRGEAGEAGAPANLAELFGEPGKQKWTPNDIVNKTVQFPGVAGAMIALQDGLLVAHCMPPGVKADTIAAFLPQMLGRMAQYAKEFEMGDLGSLTLTMGRGALQVYHAGAIYFAVLAGVGEVLPLRNLDFIAAELRRRGK
ncbi:MAG: roadblock/LC7 domain-containing protein [Verrucomicrobia bacterium]|nr:roadblock/LC7 domain-containing protein [Verrucomicrobiota bacterium]